MGDAVRHYEAVAANGDTLRNDLKTGATDSSPAGAVADEPTVVFP